MRAWRVLAVWAVLVGGVSYGQLIERSEKLSSPGPVQAREWKGLLKVEDERLWDVEFGVRGMIAPGTGKGGQMSVAAPPLTTGVFVMPWVEQSATQSSELLSILGAVSVDEVKTPFTVGFVESPAGLQRLVAFEVKAPAGQVFAFGSSVKLPGSKPPEAKDVEQVPLMAVDLGLGYRVTSRRVKVDETLASGAKWPAAWPAEAEGVLKFQVFRETGVDPETRLVRALDDAALDAFAKKFAEARGIKDPRAVTPMELVKKVAEEVTKRLSYTGSGLVECQNAGGDEGFSAVEGAFEGIDVRDALTVIRSGKGNAAERAVALAVVYRRLGLPCRVIVGFEAKPNEDRELVKKYARQQANRPVAGVRGGGVEPRCWVEVALVNEAGELGWLPVDPGKGGNSLRIGTVDGSEDVVVVATNFWPTPIRIVGALRKIPGYRAVHFALSLTQRKRAYINDQGQIVRESQTTGGSETTVTKPRNARRMFELPAGMWGYWTEPEDCPTVYQQLRVVVSRVPVTKKGPQEP